MDWMIWLLVTLAGAVAAFICRRPMTLVRILVPLLSRLAGLPRRRILAADGRVWPVFMGGRVDADRTVVLLHGFGVDSFTMLLTARVLMAKGCRVLVPDLPGFGDNAWDPARVHDEAFMMRQLELFAEAAGVQRATAIGSSMGGALCACWAHSHPERIEALILLDPAGVEPTELNDVYKAVDRDEHPLDIRTMADFDRIVQLNFQRPPRMPWLLKRDIVRQAAARADIGESILRALEPLLRDGLRARLPGIKQPVLLIWGNDDRIIDASAVPRWRAGLPDATIVQLEDCSHVPWVDQPKATFEAIEGFLNSPLTARNSGRLSATPR